ncbi:NAD(P)H-binding protein [Paenibacillus sp. FSL L8-0493]|uniref:NAD(P)H-binding protein n=1 Tax=unclassified Paenibacillus TaxID=185978 RepID=UPI0030F51A4B
MSNVLILGANGGIARHAIDLFLNETDARLTLYLRNSDRLSHITSSRTRVVEGDVLDSEQLKEAMIGQDVVYANLAGNLEEMSKTIVEAMNTTGLREVQQYIGSISKISRNH